MPQRRFLSPNQFLRVPHASLESVALDDCSTFAVHDLAALADGNLSEDGLGRLARHIPQCRTCRATLAVMIEESRRGHEVPASGEGYDLAAWIAAASVGRNLMTKIADGDDSED